MEILSALIGGIFTLVGIWMTHRLQSRQVASPSFAAYGGTPAHIRTATEPVTETTLLKVGPVIRDVGIICLLTAAVGLIVGIATPTGAEFPIGVLALGNIIFGTIGFAISGSRVRDRRWKHLLFVAIVLWPVGLMNVVLVPEQITFGMWASSIIAIFFMMAIGGLISYAFNRR